MLTVLEELDGAILEEPNCILTHLWPIASGVQVPAAISGTLSALRVQVDSYEDAGHECAELKREVFALKKTEREYKRQEEALQPMLEDELAKKLVEPQIKGTIVVMKCHAVPFKSDVLKTLPNNYESALKRTLSLRRNAARNPKLNSILLETFAELLREKWLVLVDDASVNDHA